MHRSKPRTDLLNDLISPRKQRGRHIEPEGLRGFQVNHQLVFGRRLDREVGGLLALEDAIDVAGRAPIGVDRIRPPAEPRPYPQSRERTEDERSFVDEHERAVRYSRKACSQLLMRLQSEGPDPYAVVIPVRILTRIPRRH